MPDHSAAAKDTSADKAVILAMLRDYFDGLYTADTEKLRNIFHEDVVLKAPGLRRSRDEWLKLVESRPIPENQGEPYRFSVLSLEIIAEQAMAKVDCPLLGNNYIDFIGLLKENGRWLIVNKMYCNT